VNNPIVLRKTIDALPCRVAGERRLWGAFAVLSLLTVLTTGAANAAQPQAFSDAFTGYAAGSPGDPTWETDAVGWTVGSGVFTADSRNRTFALFTPAARAADTSVEATVTVRAAVGSDWKTAGVVIYDGEGDYWHLALVEAPGAERRHFVELTESYRGTWQANSSGATRLTPLPGNDFAWQYDHPYRLRLKIADGVISGTVSETDGAAQAAFGYRLDGPAVTAGVPGLDCGGFRADFTAFQTSASRLVPKTATPPPPVTTYTAASVEGIAGTKTGWFHVEQRAGRWWLIDPRGGGFFAVGTDHVNYNVHWCERLGYAPYHRNCVAKYEGDEAAWGSATIARLRAWRFNTLGVNASRTVIGRGLPREQALDFGSTFAAYDNIAAPENWTGFPNVFSPRWPAYCRQRARTLCAPTANDSWLIGYFIDNELEWFGKNGKPGGLFDCCLAKPAGQTAKAAVLRFLQERYATVEALNRAWNAQVSSWEGLNRGTETLTGSSPQAEADKTAFVGQIAERYFSVTREAIRAAAPHHLILGCRFAGDAPPVVVTTAGRFCDVVSLNFYGKVDLERGVSVDMPGAFQKMHALSGRPMMITEWSFPAYDSGLPCLFGAGQRLATQAERARCYRLYQASAAALPFLVGSNYFMWADEPALGISSTFPEDSNYGLVDEQDRPWSLLTQAATRVNADAALVHANLLPALSVEISADGKSATITNQGGGPGDFRADLRIDGRKQTLRRQLAAGAVTTIPIVVRATPGAHLISLTADPDEMLTLLDRSKTTAARILYRSGAPSSGTAEVRWPVVVSNASAQTVVRGRISRLLREIVPPTGAPNLTTGHLRCIDGATGGNPVPVQIDGSGADAELCLLVEALPPYSCRTYYLMRDRSGASGAVTPPSTIRVTRIGSSFRADTGGITLTHDAGRADLLSEVAIGTLSLGRFTALVREDDDRPRWVAPNTTEAVTVTNGPVRFAADITVANAAGGVGGPHRYRARYRIAAATGNHWFTSRLLWIENADTVPWRLGSYFHYALSAIGGNATDDTVTGLLPGGMVGWRNPKWNAYYGFAGGLVDDFRVYFYRDASANGQEHPDVWREVGRDLAPGERYAAPQPAATFFGWAGGAATLGRIAREIRGRESLLVRIYPAERPVRARYNGTANGRMERE